MASEELTCQAQPEDLIAGTWSCPCGASVLGGTCAAEEALRG